VRPVAARSFTAQPAEFSLARRHFFLSILTFFNYYSKNEPDEMFFL
jgi:hypothetical protein